MKKLWILVLCAAFLSTPVLAMDMEQPEEMETEMHEVSINIKGDLIKVSGAQGQKLEIYNLAGVRVREVNIDSEEVTIRLTALHGCYLLKVGKVVRKISVR